MVKEYQDMKLYKILRELVINAWLTPINLQRTF